MSPKHETKKKCNICNFSFAVIQFPRKGSPTLGVDTGGSPGKGLVTNYGEGGGPTKRGVMEKVLAMLKGGHKKLWRSFYAVA